MDLVVDEVLGTVHFLLVEHGGLLGVGADHTLVPVKAIARVTEHEVRLDRRG